MSWQTLTGAAGVTVKYSNEEVERLKQLCEDLQLENEQLRVEKKSFQSSREQLKEQILQKDKHRQELQKKLQKSEVDRKLEAKAREGISKKVNKFEFEMLNYKEECNNMKEELKMLRVKRLELEYNLNQERSKRLRDIHEMDILRRANMELEAANNVFGKENLDAKKSLYEKLEKMDTVMTHNESQKRVIGSMGNEVNALNAEIAMLKEDLRRSQEVKYQTERSLDVKDRECEQLEAEVFRLRRELLEFAGTQGQKHKAFGTTGASRRGSSQMPTSHSFDFPSPPLTQEYPFRQGSAEFQPSRGESYVVSQSSLPYSFRSNSKQEDLPPPKPTDRFTASSQGKRSSTASEVLSGYDSMPTTHERPKPRKSKGKGKQVDYAATPKSRFTGSGLGLRKSDVNEFNPQGSAKMVIEKVLKKQIEERGD